jgi:hypothetical protein
MFSLLMLGLAAANTALLAYTLREWRRLRLPVLGLLAFLILALPYDTALVGAGRWLGQGPLLEVASGPRFMLFHLSVPLTLIITAALARLAGFRWAQPPWFIGGVCVLATAFAVADWQHIVVWPSLYPACWADTLRYLPSVLESQACTPGQPGIGLPGAFPLAGAVALPALLVLGGLMAWRKRWPWLVIGIATGLVLLGLPPARVGPVPGFVGDAINMLAMVGTAVHFGGRRAVDARNIR